MRHTGGDREGAQDGGKIDLMRLDQIDEAAKIALTASVLCSKGRAE